MKPVSLTYFVDFVLASGIPKLTVVKSFKNRKPFSPQSDFYKMLREGIIDMHSGGSPKSHLDSIMISLTDPNRIKLYPGLISEYKKFMGKKTLEWIKPHSATWKHGKLSVNINPEVGLVINGQPTIIKLYFKETALQKRRADIITHLLNRELSATHAGAVFGILDIRSNKLHLPPVPISGLDALLAGEAASFSTIYDNI